MSIVITSMCRWPIRNALVDVHFRAPAHAVVHTLKSETIHDVELEASKDGIGLSLWPN